MRGLVLFARARRVPVALVAAAGCVAVMWTLTMIFSDERDVGVHLVMLTTFFLVAIAAGTLEGPDDQLDRTAARRWPRMRAAHLAVALVVVVALMAVTLPTGARFGPAALVFRDAAGMLGLVALGAATLGVARSWFVPLAWTLYATLFPSAETTIQQVASWMGQDVGNRPAACTAGLFAVAGLIAYVSSGFRLNSR